MSVGEGCPNPMEFVMRHRIEVVGKITIKKTILVFLCALNFLESEHLGTLGGGRSVCGCVCVCVQVLPL